MKTKSFLPFYLFGLASTLPTQATRIELSDFSFVPDGSSDQPDQTIDIAELNDGNVLATSGSTVYFVTTFVFGENSDAHLETQFRATNGAGRIGIQVQDNGSVSVPGTGGQLVDYDGLVDQSSPSSFSFGQDLAGQTVVVLAKLQFDTNNNVTYNVRFGGNNAHNSADTLMNVWFNPTASSVEGEGPSAGDLFAIWNSSVFAGFEQQIFNQGTPSTAGTSSIINTVILTGEDATFENALALATGGAKPDGPLNLVITPNASTPGSYDFSWDGRDGKVYDLVSSEDLSSSPDSWQVWDGRAGIAGSELTGVAGGAEEKRFFALVEKDAP